MKFQGFPAILPTLFVHPVSSLKKDITAVAVEFSTTTAVFTNSFCPITLDCNHPINDSPLCTMINKIDKKQKKDACASLSCSVCVFNKRRKVGIFNTKLFYKLSIIYLCDDCVKKTIYIQKTLSIHKTYQILYTAHTIELFSWKQFISCISILWNPHRAIF